MKRFLLVAVVALASCGGDPPLPGPDLSIRVVAPAAEVEFGRAFPLEVVRTWPRDLDPGPWSDAALAPLVVRAEETEMRDDGRRIVETRRFEARAFSLDAVRVPPPRFEANPRDGGAPRAAAGAPLVIRVRPSVDRASPGAPELPGDLRSGRGPGAAWIAAFAIAAAAAAALLLRAARRPAVPAPAPAAPPAPAGTPTERALARLDALRARAVDDPAGARAFHEEAAAALREWTEEVRGVATRCRTTEEIAADAAAPRALGEVLGQCDLAKFAGAAPGAAARTSLLDDAVSLVCAGGAR